MEQYSKDRSNIVARLERLPLSWVHRRLLLVHGFGWLFDAMDVGIITFIIVVLARDWNLPTNQLGLIASASMAGMFIGGIASGIVADYWGRKKVFQITLLIFAIATLLCATAQNVSSMIIFRFFVGIGLGGELPVVSSLLSEFMPSKYRGRYIVLLESFWAYGWLIAAIVAFLVIPAYGWRSAFIIGAIPAFYVWIVRRKLPESPRWLYSKERYSEAENVIVAMEKETEKRKKISLPIIERGVEPVHKYSSKFPFTELWNKTHRKSTIMLWILWFGISFGYYGIFVWLPTLLVKEGYSMVNSFYYIIWITLAQIPGYFSASYLVERAGRKPVITVYLLLSAISAYFFGEASTKEGILICATLMSFFNLGAWGAVYAYTPEQYPTRASSNRCWCRRFFWSNRRIFRADCSGRSPSISWP